jgi:hypothetical protein
MGCFFLRVCKSPHHVACTFDSCLGAHGLDHGCWLCTQSTQMHPHSAPCQTLGPRPPCKFFGMAMDAQILNTYARALSYLKVPAQGSELCRRHCMGRGTWHQTAPTPALNKPSKERYTQGTPYHMLGKMTNSREAHVEEKGKTGQHTFFQCSTHD